MSNILWLSKNNISIITDKYNRVRKKNQDWHKSFPYPVSSDPIKQFFSLSDLCLRVMEYLIWYDNNYESIFVSQKKIAQHCGISRETVNRILGQLIRHGFILSNYNHLTSCDYKISPYLKLIPVRQVLSSLITAFKYVSIAVLTTTLLHAETIQNYKITQVNRYLDYYIYLAKRNKHILDNQDTCKRIASYDRLTISNLLQKNKKSEKKMNNPPSIDGIDWNNLTELGQAKLAPFPEAALSWAAFRMQKHQDKKEPFTYFVKLCKIYCQEHNIEPDWPLTTGLITKYKLDPFGPILTGSLIKAITTDNKFQKRQTDKPYTIPKGHFLHKDLTDEQIVQRFVDKQKAWIKTLPEPSEAIMRSMSGFFPGPQEELERLIKPTYNDSKNEINEETLTSDVPYINQDDPQSTIWEEIV